MSRRGRAICCALLAGLTALGQLARAQEKRSPSKTPEGDAAVVQFIDGEIARRLASAKVKPSARAGDEEFLRRVSLDLIGRIPTLEEADAFLSNRSRDKRAALVDALLQTNDHAEYWAGLWTNLLIGRQTPPRVDRDPLKAWIREAFVRNQPYNEFTFALVSATGDFRENGAVNFLLSHLNEDATPATSRTARVFLGVQVQCTQCHDHPFNDWTQEQFWGFNAFFRQTQRRDTFSRSGGDREFLSAELLNNQTSGPVYFERRSALMSVAFPAFLDGTKIDAGPEVDRRRELARLMTNPARPYLSEAIVNRLWGHFFGYGFTRPVDDMGPHNLPSHPELLQRLAKEFVNTGYDLRRLIRWITGSEAYQRTSQSHNANAGDDPGNAKEPLFSRMYAKQMTVEQLYDSLLVATRADQAGGNASDAVEKRRRWLAQFVVAFETDENDETTTFDGSITQALMVMNGELMQKATSAEPGSLLHQVLSENTGDDVKIRRLYLAALCRPPTAPELNRLRRIVAATGSSRWEAYQDLFWALLNSNEFLLNH